MYIPAQAGCMLFLCSYAVSLFRYVNGIGNVAYFLFESHCRNSRYITDGQPGLLVPGISNCSRILLIAQFKIRCISRKHNQLSGTVYGPYFERPYYPVYLNVDQCR